MFSSAGIVLSKLIRSANKNVLCFMHNSKRGWEAEVLQKIPQEFQPSAVIWPKHSIAARKKRSPLSPSC